MSIRVAYWTSQFDPDMEAIAGEIALLRSQFPGSIAWGLNARRWLRGSRRRGLAFHPRLHLLFRATTYLLEPAFDLSHVFGSVADWFYLQARRRRPTVLTIVEHSTMMQPTTLLSRIDRFVVECPADQAELSSLGITPERIRLIFPPVDLQRFCCTPAPQKPFTVLFASSPERADWLASRGLALLLDTAAQCPEIHFRLLWRPWGNSLPQLQTWLRNRPLRNVEVHVGRIVDMPGEYQRSHATLLPFAGRERCKTAPSSLLESLACGRPVVCTPHVGLAELIEANGAGAVCATQTSAVVEAIERVRCDWVACSERARALAEARFSQAHFISAYRRLYEELQKS